MDIKEMIFSLMMMDFDEHDIGEISKPARDVIVDQLVELAKEKKKIKGLEADREILSMDVNYHNCNTCKKECAYRPEPGERVRINCMYWMECKPAETIEKKPITLGGDYRNWKCPVCHGALEYKKEKTCPVCKSALNWKDC